MALLATALLLGQAVNPAVAKTNWTNPYEPPPTIDILKIEPY